MEMWQEDHSDMALMIYKKEIRFFKYLPLSRVFCFILCFFELVCVMCVFHRQDVSQHRECAVQLRQPALQL